MADMATIESTTSREAEIDRTVEWFIGKIVDGTATADDKAKYEQLIAQRARLMRPGRTFPYYSYRRAAG